MILEHFEKVVGQGIRKMYLLGNQHIGQPYGHLVADLMPTHIMAHIMVYDSSKDSLKDLREDIRYLLERVAGQEYKYPAVATFTPNPKFMKFLSSDKFPIVYEKEVGTGHVVFISTGYQEQEAA